MASRDNTKQVLEQLLAGLYSQEASGYSNPGDSYLMAQNNQYLGKITSNVYDNESILNQYGPFGSEYSETSIFNKYSQYGSPYGQYSVKNPYTSSPPKLFINGIEKGVITVNQYLPNNIPTATFLYAMKKRLPSLLAGTINFSINEARKLQQESYIEAQDGTYLGSLNPNSLEFDSIFNTFGEYGSIFSQTSVFNIFSEYGNQFSNLSANNKMALSPPMVYVKGQLRGYLTKNSNIQDRIDPDNIRPWAKKNVRFEIF